MSTQLDQCKNQETESKEKRFQSDTLVYTSTTIVRPKTQVKNISDDSSKRRSDQNTLIIVILLVVMNIINYMDRLTLAGKFTFFKYY